MPSSAERLQSIAEESTKKGVKPSKVTTREFLQWFGAERRGYNIVSEIRLALALVGLKTVPDFDYTYIDDEISFALADTNSGSSKKTSAFMAAPIVDPTYRIARLESANRKPVSVKPDSTLARAITLMLRYDFSQLPVMTSKREVKGIISWKSIGGRLALDKKCTVVSDCMDEANITGIETSLQSTIDIIAEGDYVLVQDKDRSITGIVTASDLSQQFGQLAEPFLLLGEIENYVRYLIYGKFTVEELREVRDDRDEDRIVDGISDLTFGEYVRLLENKDRWQKLKLAIDRSEFIKNLNQVREIRNDVMHFDPDGLSDGDLNTLRDFAKFLQRLKEFGVV